MQNENTHIDDLLISYFAGNISNADQARLSKLLKNDEACRKQYDEMARIHALTHTVRLEANKKANFDLLMTQIHQEPITRAPRFWMRRLGQIAAVLIFTVSFSISSYYIYHDLTVGPALCYQTMVPVGSKTKIILPDNTVAWLNSGSTLKYDNEFGKSTREITLEGEGYFEVTKDKSRPFLVHTKELTVKVLGTVFNISSYANDSRVEVNLVEGSVNVSFANQKNPVTLKPNHKLTYTKQTGVVETTEVDAQKSLLWTTGKLCFEEATIEDICYDLERKFDVQIQIEDESIKKETFSGSLDLNLPLLQIINYIDVDRKFSVKQIGNTMRIKNL